MNEATTPETGNAAGGRMQALVSHDWQITAILSDEIFIETDCNSGRKRRIRKTSCKCGQPFLIEYDAPLTCRRDGKRIFYPDDVAGMCAFRCRNCLEPVHETVPGAEYGEG